MEKEYYLLSEEEVLMIVSEMKEILGDLEDIIKSKKLRVNDSRDSGIKFSRDFLNNGA